MRKNKNYTILLVNYKTEREEENATNKGKSKGPSMQLLCYALKKGREFQNMDLAPKRRLFKAPIQS